MGKISHKLGISLQGAQVLGFFESAQIEHRRDLLLSLMPQGTEMIEVVKMAPMNLSVEVQLVFEHPFFKDGSKIELDQARVVWLLPDERIGQGNIVTGVRYTGPDGRSLLEYSQPPSFKIE
jgi:hypothetical protein